MIAKKLIIVLAIALLISLGCIYLFLLDKQYSNRMYPNIYIDSYNLGGKTFSQLEMIKNQRDRDLNNVTLSIFYNNQPVATYSAKEISLRSNFGKMVDAGYMIGRGKLNLSILYQRFNTIFKLAKYQLISQIEYDRSPLNDTVNLIEDKYNKPARNALFKFENSRVISFRQEDYGLKILSDAFFQELDKQLEIVKFSPHNLTLTIKDEQIKPEVTLSQANQYGIEEEIAEGKSDFSHSIPERIHNIILATSKFNGVIIPKGKEFSFDDTVGDISSLTGYKPAYIIKNGKTVLGDGGGVCQVSTTLFRAALNAGLTITERNAHDYRVGYYENDSKPGFDATVFGPSVDLKFKNDTPAAILIQTEIDNEKNLVYFRLYGKKDGRRVEISSIRLYDQQPAPPAQYQDDPTLKRGVVKQVDFAAGGAKASFDYKVVRGDTVIFQKTFYSNYRPWQAVYLVGTSD